MTQIQPFEIVFNGTRWVSCNTFESENEMVLDSIKMQYNVDIPKHIITANNDGILAVAECLESLYKLECIQLFPETDDLYIDLLVPKWDTKIVRTVSREHNFTSIKPVVALPKSDIEFVQRVASQVTLEMIDKHVAQQKRFTRQTGMYDNFYLNKWKTLVNEYRCSTPYD